MHSTIKLSLANIFDEHGKVMYRHSSSNYDQILVQVNTKEFGPIAAFAKYFPGGKISERKETYGSSVVVHRIEYTFDKAVWVLRTLQKYSVAHTSVIQCAMEMVELKGTRNKEGIYPEKSRAPMQECRRKMEEHMAALRGDVPFEVVAAQVMKNIEENGFPTEL